MIEKGYVKIGENLYSKEGKHSAQVMADASLIYEGEAGSIHKISAKILKKENNNGWSYWYIKRENKFISIDELRHDYEKRHLNDSFRNYNQELAFDNSIVKEPTENFLTYGNNGI